MVNERDIQLALADLESQEVPNYLATARKYDIQHTTLMRRHKHHTKSNAEATSTFRRLLTDEQEEVLVQRINHLSDRGMPPTPRIVKNLVEEMVKQPVGENWVLRFRERHKYRITSVYLRAIDQTRQVADNSMHFNHFYQNVIHKFTSPPNCLLICGAA